MHLNEGRKSIVLHLHPRKTTAVTVYQSHVGMREKKGQLLVGEDVHLGSDEVFMRTKINWRIMVNLIRNE